MGWKLHRRVLLLAVFSSRLALADVVTLQIGPASRDSVRRDFVRFDLSAIPKGANIYRADLRIFRTKEIDGRDDAAMIDVEIYPVFSTETDGKPRAGEEPLELAAPWFDRFDVTQVVGRWIAGRPNGGFFVRTCPHWDKPATRLNIWYEGRPQNVPRQVKGVTAFHRDGQTFITFEEIDDRSQDASPPWEELKTRLDNIDAERTVRYLVFRHDRPIDAKTVARAELLGEVKPMSGYNVLGRSVDQLIKLHRARAVDDVDLAKSLARGNYFARYHPDIPEMGEVAIRRLAIEDGKPLPPRTGLFVHHPSKAGRACYAVVPSVDGVANMSDFSKANSLAAGVAETTGIGRPVLQGQPDVTVFFDYPGQRLHYVQWAAPPRSNLPNRYYNWGVFLPRGYRDAHVKRLSIFFHDAKQRFLKPPWPHRQDTVLLSPHDGPYRCYGYGYHEALGTLRSFKQGRVKPFFANRVDAMLEWAVERYGADRGRVSCGGHGTWGGTAALQYALRRPGTVAYAMADEAPDPDPRQTPHQYRHYGRDNEKPRQTHRADVEAVWGKVEWDVEAESGKSIRDEANLAALVRSDPDTTMPYLSLGAGSMHVTWKQQTELMKAYLDTGNGFMSEFFWGGKNFLPLPDGVDRGGRPFEPRADRPLLGCRPSSHHPNPAFFGPDGQFTTGKRGYGGGSRLNTRPRWDPEDVVDTKTRLEMTIYAARNVTYAGAVECDVTVRNTRKFRPGRGEKVLWKAVREKPPGQQEGEVTVERDGLIVLPGIRFADPARLILQRKKTE